MEGSRVDKCNTRAGRNEGKREERKKGRTEGRKEGKMKEGRKVGRKDEALKALMHHACSSKLIRSPRSTRFFTTSRCLEAECSPCQCASSLAAPAPASCSACSPAWPCGCPLCPCAALHGRPLACKRPNKALALIRGVKLPYMACTSALLYLAL